MYQRIWLIILIAFLKRPLISGIPISTIHNGTASYSKKDLVTTNKITSNLYRSNGAKGGEDGKINDITKTRSHEIFMKDILVRRMARLSHGESCDPLKQIILDHPTRTHFSTKNVSVPETNATILTLTSGVLFAEEVLRWQNALLQNGQPFCNYKLNLECSSKTSTCECKIGKTVSVQIGAEKFKRCVLLEGHNCGEDYADADGTLYYDPSENLNGWTRPKSPPCIQNTTCVRKQFFYHKKCWCDRDEGNERKSCENNMGISEKELVMILDRNAVIADNFVVNIDGQCNADFQKDLLNPSPMQRIKTADRLETLHTLSDYDINFCSLNLYLNCTKPDLNFNSDTKKTITSRCDCWRSLAFEKGHCRIQNYHLCNNSFQIHHQFYPQGAPSSIFQMGQMLHMEFNPRCIEAAVCQTKLLNTNKSVGNQIKSLFIGQQLIQQRCHCINPNLAGPFCNETKSMLINLFTIEDMLRQQAKSSFGYDYYSENQYQNHNPDEINLVDLYHEFNRYFNILEDRMRLPYDSICYAKNHPYFESLVNYLIQIQYNIFPTSESQSLTFDESFKKWLKVIKILKVVIGSNIMLCNGFLGLRCLPVEHRCRCMKDLHWDSVKSECRINRGTYCDPHLRMTVFNFTCSVNSECVYSQIHIKNSEMKIKQCKCNNGFTGPGCQFKMRKTRTGLTFKGFHHFGNITNEGNNSNNFLFSFRRTPEEQGLQNPALRDNTVQLNGTSKDKSQVLSRSIAGLSDNLPSFMKYDEKNKGQDGIQGDRDLRPPSSDSSLELQRQIPLKNLKITAINNLFQSMNLGLKDPCNSTFDDPKFQKQFFSINLDEFMRDSVNFGSSGTNGAVFRWLWFLKLPWTGNLTLCDGLRFLACSPQTGLCVCNETYDLVGADDGRCYIKTNDFCGNRSTTGVVVTDNRDPPNCLAGHKCDKTRFSVHRCRLELSYEQPFNRGVNDAKHFYLFNILTLTATFVLSFKYL